MGLRGISTVAVALVASLLVADPSIAQTAEEYRQRAIELSRTKSWDEAIANYHKALALDDNDALTHSNLALTLKYKGDARQSVDEFEATLRLKPKWAEAHYGLGATWYDLQDLEGARKELRTAVELNPGNADSHRLLARVYAQQNDPTSADRELRRALQYKPSAEIHFELGLAEGQLGNLETAATQFREAIHLNQGLAQAHAMLGVTLRRQGKHVEARDFLSPICRLFAEGFETRDLNEAKSLLADLAQ